MRFEISDGEPSDEALSITKTFGSKLVFLILLIDLRQSMVFVLPLKFNIEIKTFFINNDTHCQLRILLNNLRRIFLK